MTASTTHNTSVSKSAKAAVLIQRRVCQLLFIISETNPVLSVTLLRCTPQLVEKLSRCLTQTHDKRLLWAACGILWHLADSSEAGTRALLKARAVPRLIRILLTYPEQWHVVVMVAGVVEAMTWTLDDYALQQLGRCSMLLDTLGMAWYRYQDIPLIADSTMAILSRIHH